MVVNKILRNLLTRTRISNSDIIFFCSSGEISSDIIYKIKSIRLNFQHIMYRFFYPCQISSHIYVNNWMYLYSHNSRTGIVIGSERN